MVRQPSIPHLKSFLLTPSADFFDETGAPFDLEDPDLVKRQNPAMVAARFGGLFKKWGKRVWDFFYCMGLNVAWKCGDEVSLLDLLTRERRGVLTCV